MRRLFFVFFILFSFSSFSLANYNKTFQLDVTQESDYVCILDIDTFIETYSFTPLAGEFITYDCNNVQTYEEELISLPLGSITEISLVQKTYPHCIRNEIQESVLLEFTAVFNYERNLEIITFFSVAGDYSQYDVVQEHKSVCLSA